MADENFEITIGLVAAKVYNNSSEQIKQHMKNKKWLYWSPDEVRSKVSNLSRLQYENDPAIITAKILART